MMARMEWRSWYPKAKPGASEAEVASLERDWGVRLPDALREGYMAVRRGSVFKDGEDCPYAVTGPMATGGQCLGYFQELEPLAHLRDEHRGLINWSDEFSQFDPAQIFPLSLTGDGGWLYLDYGRDPTRSNPEVWGLDIDAAGTPDDPFLRRIAPDFDSFIAMLVSERAFREMGFQV